MEKTAMQILIDWYDSVPKEVAQKLFFIKATQLLEKEKNQIVDAYRTGKSHEANGTLIEINMDGIEYFTKTFKKD